MMRPDPAARASRNRKRRISGLQPLLAASSGIAIVLLAGCGGGSGSTGSVSGTITIAAVPGIADAPLYMAAKDGTFTAEGLNVTIKNYTSQSAALQAVESGQADIAAADYGNIFERQDSTPNLRILADGYDAGSGSAQILVSPHYPKLINPTQLLQTPIGLPDDSLLTSVTGSAGTGSQPESLISAAATAVIQDYVASAADTLTWQSMPQEQEVAELQTGQLQAALLTEPYIYQAESSFGATPLVDVFNGETANLPLSGYVSVNAWVTGNPTAVADFQAGISKEQSKASMVGPVQLALTKLPDFPGMTAAAAKMVTIGTYPASVGDLGRVLSLMTTQRILAVRSGSISVPKMLVNGQ